MKTFNRSNNPSKFQKMLGIAIYFAGSKRELARQLGCSPTTLHNWTSGRSEPPCAKLVEIAKMKFDAESVKSFRNERKSDTLKSVAL